MQLYFRDFSVDEEASLEVSILVEFLNLPVSWWPYLKDLIYPLDNFVCFEPDKFFSSQPTQWVCVKVDLSRDIEDSIEINWKRDKPTNIGCFISISWIPISIVIH